MRFPMIRETLTAVVPCADARAYAAPVIMQEKPWRRVEYALPIIMGNSKTLFPCADARARARR